MKNSCRFAAIMTLQAITPYTLARAADLDPRLPSPRVTTLFEGADMPHTERTAAVGRRLFVTSGPDLFEVVRKPRGGYERVSIAQATVDLADGQAAPAVFLGLAAYGQVLYATATAFDASGTPQANALYRVKLGRRAGEISSVSSIGFTEHAAPFMPNGMAVDWQGNVFVANSFSTYTGEAAILKLTVTPEPLAFEELAWLSASDGGAFPNGVQLDRGTLYLTSMSTVLKVPFERDGSAGPVQSLYAASSDNFLDDFTMVPGGLVVCEIDNPFTEPSAPVSQLTIITGSGPHPGRVVAVIPLADTGILPSSVARFGGGPFGNGSLLVTDYFSGGLYTVGF